MIVGLEVLKWCDRKGVAGDRVLKLGGHFADDVDALDFELLEVGQVVTTAGAGHGGMDFFVIHGLIEAIKRKVPTPMDVYDAAAWSAITPLSEQSIELGNQTVDFPDFTGGQWMYRKPTFAFTNEF